MSLFIHSQTGPADQGGYNTTIDRSDSPYKSFVTDWINIHDDDHLDEFLSGGDEDTSKKRRYIVKLTEVGKISNFQDLNQEGKQILQAVDIIMRNVNYAANMYSYDKSPKRFYFPQHLQTQIMNRFVSEGCLIRKDYFNSDTLSIMPNIGITQSTKLTQSGNIFLTQDRFASYIMKESKSIHQRRTQQHGGYLRQQQQQQDEERVMCKVLQVDERNREYSIAGVLFRDVPISDRKKREDIRKAFRKLKMHVSYVRNKYPQGWEDGKLADYTEGSIFPIFLLGSLYNLLCSHFLFFFFFFFSFFF